MNNKRLKSNKGITLIALIITIIVLLILAMVSIKLIWDGGIIAHAKNAVDKYGKTQQNEIDQINHIFGNNENQNNVPEELQKYILGDDLKGQSLFEKCNIDFENIGTWSFKNQLNGENVEILTALYTKNSEEIIINGKELAMYIKYKNKAYIVLAKLDETAETEEELITTKSVSMIYEPKGKEGQKIEYSIDGKEENKKEWTILYDNGDNVEIISPEAMGSLTLGKADEEAIGNNNFEKAVNSYNNAIDRINAYTRSFVTNTNKIAVRSVGSNPENPDSRNTTKYESEKLESWNCSYNMIPVTVNGVGEGSDNNYEQDLIRMWYHGVAGTGSHYWLASRYVECYSDRIFFSVHRLDDCGHMEENNDYCLWDACNNGDADAWKSLKIKVRPVVKISK